MTHHDSEQRRPEAKEIAAKTTPQGFAPRDEYLDGRKPWDWVSKYPTEARRGINCEATVLMVALFFLVICSAIALSISDQTWIIRLADKSETQPLGVSATIGLRFLAIYCVGSVGGITFAIKWLVHAVATGRWHLDRRYWRMMVPWVGGVYSGSKNHLAIELAPTDLNLMRDVKFIDAVGLAAKETGVPVILAGSTLAHAYYQLRRQGATVVATGEKGRTRVRRIATFGKLVRDKIPTRIAERQEAEITKKVPPKVVKGFLTSKLIEEALEIRDADTPEKKLIEVADLYEVVRALAQAEGLTMREVETQAQIKREKTGGFEEGLVLVQTGILGQSREALPGEAATQVLARKTSGDTFEIPFTLFGFMEINQTRSIFFDELGVRLDVTLKADRLEFHISNEAEQFELPLDLTVAETDS